MKKIFVVIIALLMAISCEGLIIPAPVVKASNSVKYVVISDSVSVSDSTVKNTVSDTLVAVNGNQSEIAVEYVDKYAFNGDTLYAKMVNAGRLDSLLVNFSDCEKIHTLIIEGSINAKDFRYIKWNMLNIENVDLSNVAIEAYKGDSGTNEGYEAEYAANTIPLGAFFYWESHFENGVDVDNEPKFYDEGMSSIKTIKLPSSIVGIERNAFARAYNLVEINIPEGVTHIDYVSFRYCVSLKSITIPSTVTNIGLWAFTEMNALETVYCYAVNPPSTNQSFGGVDDIVGARGWVRNDTYNSEIKAVLYVPNESINAYKSSEWNKYFKEIKGI